MMATANAVVASTASGIAAQSSTDAIPSSAQQSDGWVDGFVVEDVDPGHKDFKWIVSKVTKTSDANITIDKVFRIKNSTTWQSYKEKRAQICSEIGGGRVLEKRLFHGSPWCMNIAKEGFNMALASPAGAYGKGVYFSEQARESCAYAKKVGAQQKYYMLICKVALGVVTTESAIQPGTHCVHRNTKYVIYDEKQAYPSFLIEFK